MTKRTERKKRKSDEIEEIHADDVSEDATAAHVKALLAYTERRVLVPAFGEEGACVFVHPGASSLSDDEIVTRATKVATMVQTPIVAKRYRYDMGIRVVFASLFTRPHLSSPLAFGFFRDASATSEASACQHVCHFLTRDDDASAVAGSNGRHLPWLAVVSSPPQGRLDLDLRRRWRPRRLIRARAWPPRRSSDAADAA